MPETPPPAAVDGPDPDRPGRFPIALILEAAPSAVADARPLLDRASASRLADALATDLLALDLGLERFGLTVVGALYTIPELLRPGLPLIESLEALHRRGIPPGPFQAGLLALGSDSRRGFPLAELNPGNHPGAGPLRVIPLLLTGERDALGQVAGALENRLMQRARLGPDHRTLLEHLFDCPFPNASFATLADVCALTHVQLESQDLGPLWSLIEQALFRPEQTFEAELPSGNRFVWEQHEVRSPFFTFDQWASDGPGATVAEPDVAGAYTEWMRAQRQYAAGLELHGIPMRQWLEGGQAGDHVWLDSDWLVETTKRWSDAEPARHLSITHQYVPSVGTVAYSVLVRDEAGLPVALEHHYPLLPGAVEALIGTLKTRCEREGLTRDVSHPGSLIVAPGRRLWAAHAPASR